MRLTFFLFALLPALAMGQFAHQDGSHITIVPDLTESQEPGLRYRLACSDAALYFTPVPVQIQIKVVPEATEGQNQLELEPVTFGTMLLHDRRSSMFMDLPAMPAGHYFLVCWADNYVPSWYHFVVE